MNFIEWPRRLFRSQSAPAFHLVHFNRSGGQALSGVERVTRTDRGFWRAEVNDIILNAREADQWRSWHALSQSIGGRAGVVALSFSQWMAQKNYSAAGVSGHADGSSFADGAGYRSSTMRAYMHETAEIGQTVVKIRVDYGIDHPAGLHFSHEWALYLCGAIRSQSDAVFEVPISPAIRRRIPAGAELELTEPGCLMKLTDDRAMDVVMPLSRIAKVSLKFVEALEVWEELAEEEYG
ncbi:hypothetical protein PsAD2_04621 [Pseudovibrio axinellae]|uniref:Uncharacterized protein n=1 Tax=Pseudovibrio axinellae TaxID=989403 RepID=A0A165SVS3_9HYPH|nr:hypothetical protein [Pseudovibrio axinellae]KZL04538.1 hypothetical protein PsAD2_04621 [Pseudovibrio axinellae]SEQ73897.1 hypothetical protein SAMN05421798_10487 [Pseudovibrio axinellae]